MLAIGTGNDAVDAAFLGVAGLLSLIGTSKGGQIVRRVLKSAIEVAVRTYFSDLMKEHDDMKVSIGVNIEKIKAIEKDLSQHKDDDAIDAMIQMGFIEAGEEAILVLDATGKTLTVSPALCRIAGLTPDEAKDGAWKDIIHAEDRQKTLDDLGQFVRGNIAQKAMRFRFTKPNGSWPSTPVFVRFVRKQVSVGGVRRIVGLVTVDTPSPPSEKLP